MSSFISFRKNRRPEGSWPGFSRRSFAGSVGEQADVSAAFWLGAADDDLVVGKFHDSTRQTQSDFPNTEHCNSKGVSR